MAQVRVLTFLYYEFADQVIAIEPDPMMLEQSLIKAREATVPIEVVPGDAQKTTVSNQFVRFNRWNTSIMYDT